MDPADLIGHDPTRSNPDYYSQGSITTPNASSQLATQPIGDLDVDSAIDELHSLLCSCKFTFTFGMY